MAPIRGKKPQQDEAEVAVDRPRAGRVLERHRADVVFELTAAARRRIEEPGGEAGRVFEKIREGRAGAIAAASIPGTPARHARRGATAPVSTSCMKMVAVAIGLVSEARSNAVSIVDRPSRFAAGGRAFGERERAEGVLPERTCTVADIDGCGRETLSPRSRRLSTRRAASEPGTWNPGTWNLLQNWALKAALPSWLR